MRRRLALTITWPLAVVVALTGISALVLQVVWQRVISLNSGVDLASSTTVVAGFLAGLGIGGVLGGHLADRIGPRRSMIAMAATNTAVAAFAWVSTSVFYDMYREVAPDLDSRAALFGFNFALLLVPTVLEGMSLPFIARIASREIGGSAARVGRLYGINTVGAGVGAVLAGWYLMGEHGFVAATRFAAACNLAAAAVLVVLARREPAATTQPGETQPGETQPAPVSTATTSTAAGEDAASAGSGARPRRLGWYLAIAWFGAVALAFEQVFFRLIDAVGRSNSYSFSLVLAMYLGCWGVGAVFGARIVRRTTDHRHWFLWLQFSSGAVAAVTLLALIRLAPRLGLEGEFERWFSSDGFVAGFPLDRLGEVAGYGIGIPVLLMGLPVLLLGMAYPFAQAVVTRDLGDVGRNTGTLVAANIGGSVLGTLVTGFVLIDALGTAGTLRLLCVALAVGMLAVITTHAPRQRIVGIVAVAALVAAIASLPGNAELWAFLVGSERTDIDVAEDHSCGSVHKLTEGGVGLVINGAAQNGQPYDDFHILIGLLATLVQDAPEDNLAIGFGIGSTTSALLADPRVERATTVELCGGNYELARRRAKEGVEDFRLIFEDPRAELLTGDGRRHLLVADERYDAIVVDTLRPTSANAGSHYSVEFHQLVASKLADTGVFAQWVPSPRVLRSAAAAFPHVVTATVTDYNNSVVFVGSNAPIDVDTATLLERFDAIDPGRFTSAQRARLRQFIADWTPTCITNGTVVPIADDRLVNTDLAPKDEYFLNHRSEPPDTPVPSC